MIKLWRRRVKKIYVVKTESKGWQLIYVVKVRQGPSQYYSYYTYQFYFAGQCLYDRFGKDSNYLNEKYKLPENWKFPADCAAFLNQYGSTTLSSALYS